jgi:tetratricopeptide (TPR) repeat protein
MEVLTAQSSVLGENHPETITAKSGLACLYFHQERYEESEKLTATVFAWRLKFLGDDHPSTLHSWHAMSVDCSRHPARMEEAARLIDRAVEVATRRLGKDHPDTLVVLFQKAVVLQMQGQLNEAEELARRVVEDGTRVRGGGHPDTINSMELWASSLRDLGNYEKAVEVLSKCVQWSEQNIGAEHPLSQRRRDSLLILKQKVYVE